jgi:hypothetical protein
LISRLYDVQDKSGLLEVLYEELISTRIKIIHINSTLNIINNNKYRIILTSRDKVDTDIALIYNVDQEYRYMYMYMYNEFDNLTLYLTSIHVVNIIYRVR